MEVTKWLKPSISVSRNSDSASVQAVTRVNAEQTSKRTMRRPTRLPFRGRLKRLGEAERRGGPDAGPGWRRGSQYRRSRVTPVEGRDLSSRLTQQAERDLEIGQPINSENCSETADGVARESEGRSRLSLLRAVRQDQP